MNENRLMRRVQGYHNYRLDGIGDILTRCRGASVLDLGCSRGQIGHDFVNNGATLLHGCDIDPESVNCARGWYLDFRAVESRFEVCDLTKGAPFGDMKYDIILMIAVYHKIKRQMSEAQLSDLIINLGSRTKQFFCWRGTSDKPEENEQEMRNLDRDLGKVGLKRVQTSRLSVQLGTAAIWARY